MRDYVIYDMYTDDRMFRYEVYKHPNGMYEVCVQSREAEDFAVSDILLVNEHEMAQLLDIAEPDDDDWDGLDCR